MLQSRSRRKPRFQNSKQAGFTLLEVIIVVTIISVLMAIVAPGWLRFLDTQRLISAQSVVYQGMQEAQGKAQQNHVDWQFSIRDVSGFVEWGTHSGTTDIGDVTWKKLSHFSIQIDEETTLQQFGTAAHTIRFDQKGNVASRRGRVTLSSKRFDSIKRCVYASTIIGAFRQSKEQTTPHDGDFCY